MSRTPQTVLEDVVQELSRRQSAGNDDLSVTVVQQALAGAIREAGLPEQPQKWVADTATEIAAGRHVRVDRHVDRPDRPDRSDPVSHHSNDPSH